MSFAEDPLYLWISAESEYTSILGATCPYDKQNLAKNVLSGGKA
jgi:hypothetical protein